MRVTITGATGLIGPHVVSALKERGAEVTVLSHDPDGAQARLGVEAQRWDLLNEVAPVKALAGRDAILHLAGENVAQRWSIAAKQKIRESRLTGTHHLVAGIRECAQTDRPRVLVSSSAVGYYGPHAQEPIDEEAPAGSDFLAQVCLGWEREAQAACQLGLRVVTVRTGIVLDRDGGALAKMLPAFLAGVGGPVAGGHQYMPWIHREDVVGMMICALEQKSWSGPINATAPEPVTNREFSQALGRALHRPSFFPVPGVALRLLYGEMAQIVTTGVRAVPAKPLVLGYRFDQADLHQALSVALG